MAQWLEFLVADSRDTPISAKVGTNFVDKRWSTVGIVRLWTKSY
jgi:hypothetical protein